jgi:4'-phosphopantetheinyl transferase EntD
VIESILWPGVAAAEAFSDAPGVTLFPEEEAVVAKAVGKRRREFTTARGCARIALARIGVPAVPIVPGLRGAPQWPAGVVGSITHCAGYRACAVAHAQDVVAIGVDAEPNEQLPDGVLDVVSSVTEQKRLTSLAESDPGVHWDRVLFSAKESVYKAWFPITGQWLGFEDASITIGARNGRFSAQLLVGGPEVNGVALTGFSGRWLVGGGLIVTAIVVPRLP